MNIKQIEDRIRLIEKTLPDREGAEARLALKEWLSDRKRIDKIIDEYDYLNDIDLDELKSQINSKEEK